MPSALEQTRTRFANSLIGSWSNASGSFSIVMDNTLRINADGTGVFTGYGCFGYAKGETHLEWRQSRPFEIEIRFIREVSFEPDEELDDDEPVIDESDEPRNTQEDGSPRWRTVRYDFVEVTHDLGTEIGLIEVNANGKPLLGFVGHSGFLGSLSPMSYSEHIRIEGTPPRPVQDFTPSHYTPPRYKYPKIGFWAFCVYLVPYLIFPLGCYIVLNHSMYVLAEKKMISHIGFFGFLIWCVVAGRTRIKPDDHPFARISSFAAIGSVAGFLLIRILS